LADTRTVVLYGNSLGLGSMGASLGGQENLRIVQVKACEAESIQRLLTLRPDVVIFDLAIVKPEVVVSLFLEHPEVRLIALDLAGSRLLVLSGIELKGLATTDLREAIWGKGSPAAR
jgi:hypothetical protein